MTKPKRTKPAFQTKKEVAAESVAPVPPRAPTTAIKQFSSVSPRPHWITISLGLFSPVIAVVAAYIAFQSLNTSQRSMKVGQRAYLTYQVAVLNAKEIVDALRADKDFFWNYQVTVSNVGNTPASVITPDISVGIDPDRTAVMVNFPNGVPFELGPKETRVLTGQALFKHFRNVRKIPGLSSGLNGRLKYEDAFREPQVKQVCYTLLVSGNSASSGMCGTVLQVLQIK